jgi:hypothetical protein
VLSLIVFPIAKTARLSAYSQRKLLAFTRSHKYSRYRMGENENPYVPHCIFRLSVIMSFRRVNTVLPVRKLLINLIAVAVHSCFSRRYSSLFFRSALMASCTSKVTRVAFFAAGECLFYVVCWAIHQIHSRLFGYGPRLLWAEQPVTKYFPGHSPGYQSFQALPQAG